MNAMLLVLIAALAASTLATASDPVAGGVGSQSPATPAAATDPIRGKAVFTNPESGTLHVADLRTQEVTHAIAVGKSPGAVVVNAVSGTAYVVDEAAPGSLVAVDIESGRVIHRTTVGNRPTHISADFPRGELYVSNRADGSVSIVHAATMKVIAAIEIGSEPGMSAVDARRGLLYVVSAAQGTVDVIDLEYRQLAARVAVGRSPGAATVDERSGKVYVNNVEDRTVSVIDPATFTAVRTIPSGTGSTAGTMSSVHRRYYLPNADDNRVTVIDTQQDQIVALVQVGRGPRQAVLSATEDEVYVLNREDASVSFIDANSTNVFSTAPTGSRPGLAIALDGYLMTMDDLNLSPERSPLTTTPITVPETALATEYVDIKRQRYLHTANSQEARLIGDGLYGEEWRRTMRFFRVWTKQEDGRVPVCQFSSATAAELSRVFTVTKEECEALKANPAWIDEGVSYYVSLPGPDGNCASGTEPLYRLYNNGRDGIIAHRYVREIGVRDTMASAGWTAEGNGAAAIFACVPALRPQVTPDVKVDDPSDAPDHFQLRLRSRLR